MADEEILVDANFPLFSRRRVPQNPNPNSHQNVPQNPNSEQNDQNPSSILLEKEPNSKKNSLTESKNPKKAILHEKEQNINNTLVEKEQNPKKAVLHEKDQNPNPSLTSFKSLGLAQWAVDTCLELGIKKPTPVQAHCIPMILTGNDVLGIAQTGSGKTAAFALPILHRLAEDPFGVFSLFKAPVQAHCIPKILNGNDVLGIAQTGSGKTAAFALPILHRLAEDPFGVFSLVITPTRELAYQLADQFRALGSGLGLRCLVVVGGLDVGEQAQKLMGRPHVVVATPGRIKVLLEDYQDMKAVFSNTKFLVLDEADRVLDVGFQDELRVIFKCLPKKRQTLLFSATMTDDLKALIEVSANKAYFYEAYEGFKTVESLKQQYALIPKNVREVYLLYILSKLEEMSVRSVIIFVSTCRSCHLLSLMLEELELDAAALYSFKSQSLRLSALNRFKSGKVQILIATDVASRGLDIPTVDLVINYDIPSYARDYVHRVGRTARAGRGGLAISFVTENDLDLIHEVETELGKQLEKFECKENEVLSEISKVYKAKRIAKMKMMDDGFEDIAKSRKEQKLKTLAEKGLLKKKRTGKKRKRVKAAE